MAVKIRRLFTMYIILWYGYGCTYGEEHIALLDFIKDSLELTIGAAGLPEVDRVYVLNLDIRYHRWVNTKRELEAFGLFPQRVAGINGWKLDRRQLKKIYRHCVEKKHYNELTPGQIGCLLSHLSILYDALIEQYRCIWVLEDDILVLNNLREISDLINRLDQFDPEWDVLFTDVDGRGCCFEEIVTFERIMGSGFNYGLVYDSAFTPQENEDFRRIQCRLCTHSMLISSRGIKKLLDYFQSIKIAFPIDIQMHCCPNKRFYVSKKEYVTNGLRETSDTSCRPHL